MPMNIEEAYGFLFSQKGGEAVVAVMDSISQRLARLEGDVEAPRKASEQMGSTFGKVNETFDMLQSAVVQFVASGVLARFSRQVSQFVVGTFYRIVQSGRAATKTLLMLEQTFGSKSKAEWVYEATRPYAAALGETTDVLRQAVAQFAMLRINALEAIGTISTGLGEMDANVLTMAADIAMYSGETTDMILFAMSRAIQGMSQYLYWRMPEAVAKPFVEAFRTGDMKKAYAILEEYNIAGYATKMADSFEGSMKTIRSTWISFFKLLSGYETQVGSLMDVIAGIAVKVKLAMRGWMYDESGIKISKKCIKLYTAFWEAVNPMVEKAGDLLVRVVNGIIKMMDYLGEHPKILKIVFLLLGAVALFGIVGIKFFVIFGRVMAGMKAFFGMFKIFITVFKSLSSVLGLVGAGPIGWIIAGIILLIALVVMFRKKLTWVADVWKVWVGAFKKIWAVLKPFFVALWGVFRKLWEAIKPIVKKAGWVLISVVMGVVLVIVGLLIVQFAILVGLFRGLGYILWLIWEGFRMMWGAIKIWFKTLIAVFKQLWAVGKMLIAVIRFAIEVFTKGWGKAYKNLQASTNEFTSSSKGIWEDWVSDVAYIWKGMVKNFAWVMIKLLELQRATLGLLMQGEKERIDAQIANLQRLAGISPEISVTKQVDDARRYAKKYAETAFETKARELQEKDIKTWKKELGKWAEEQKERGLEVTMGGMYGEEAAERYEKFEEMYPGAFEKALDERIRREDERLKKKEEDGFEFDTEGNLKTSDKGSTEKLEELLRLQREVARERIRELRDVFEASARLFEKTRVNINVEDGRGVVREKREMSFGDLLGKETETLIPNP